MPTLLRRLGFSVVRSTSASLHDCVAKQDKNLLGPLSVNAWTSMASADFCSDIAFRRRIPTTKASPQISDGRTHNSSPVYTGRIRRLGPDEIGTIGLMHSLPASRRLAGGSCSSDREFTGYLLHIPCTPRHPSSQGRSSCHQGLPRDLRSTGHFLIRVRSPVVSSNQPRGSSCLTHHKKGESCVNSRLSAFGF